MKKEVLILITDNYADWEIGYIAPILNDPSRRHVIRTVAIEEKTILSQGGLKVTADYNINCLPSQFEMIILVGGTYWSNEQFNIPQVKMYNCQWKLWSDTLIIKMERFPADILLFDSYLLFIKLPANSIASPVRVSQA